MSHTHRGFRDRFQPLLGDYIVTGETHPVGVLVKPFERGIDLGHRLTSRSRQGEIAVTFHGDGVTLARLFVELDITGFAIGHEGRCFCGKPVGA